MSFWLQWQNVFILPLLKMSFFGFYPFMIFEIRYIFFSHSLLRGVQNNFRLFWADIFWLFKGIECLVFMKNILNLGQYRLCTVFKLGGQRRCCLFFFNLLKSIKNKTRSEEHTSELQSLMRISYAVFC